MKNYSRHIRKRERRNGKSAYQVVLEVGVMKTEKESAVIKQQIPKQKPMIWPCR